MLRKFRLGQCILTNFALWLGASLFVLASGSYLLWFGGWQFWLHLSSKQSHWGQFGDFMGGLLNPLIGLLTILLISRTLKQNDMMLRQAARELVLTRREIKRGISIQEDARNALKAELAASESSKIKHEMEEAIRFFESELDALEARRFASPIKAVGKGTPKSDTHYSFADLVRLLLPGVTLRQHILTMYPAHSEVLAIWADGLAVIDSLTNVTFDLMPYLATTHYKSYWHRRAKKSVDRVNSWGAFAPDIYSGIIKDLDAA